MSGYNKKPRKSKVPNLQDPNKWKPQQDPLGYLTSKAGAGSKLSLDFLSGLGGVDVRPDNNKGGSSGTGSTVIPSGNGLHNPFAKGSSFFDMLQGSYDTNGLITLLQSLGNNNGKGLDPKQADSWNKQLLDMILQQYLNQEQRSYNESVLKEQRTYDAPTNQLARLMGAGISRDAAIQMMSGSGSGSGAANSNLIGGAAQPLQPGLDPSEVKLNDIQGKTAIANTILGGIGTVSGLVSMGFSIPQSISQIKILKNQAYMTQRQREAYDDASQAFNILSSADVPLDSDSYGSINATIGSIASLAEKGNLAAKAFIDHGGTDRLATNAPYASQFFKELYRNERASSDYSELYDLDVGQKQAQLNLMYLDADKLVAETDKLNAEVFATMNLAEVYDRQVVYYEEQSKLLDEQIKTEPKRRAYLEAQRQQCIANAKLAREQAEYYKANAYSVELQNNQIEAWQNGVDPITGKTGLQLDSERTILGLVRDTRKIAYENDKGLYQVEVDAMYNNFEKGMALDALHHAYATGQLNALAKVNPEMKQYLYLCRIWDDLGVFKDREQKLTSGKYDNKFWVFGSSGYNKPLELDVTNPANQLY